MFTLQILDSGQPFLLPIGERAVVLGRDQGTDVVLRASGVAARHLRLVPSPGAVRFETIDGASVLVDGVPMTAGELALGQRIEIGGAVLVVGRSIARAARPEDVLSTAPARAGRARERAPRRDRGRPAMLGGIALAILVVAALVLFGPSSGDGPGLHEVRRLRRIGDFAAARAELQRVRARWVGDDAARLAVLQGEADRIDAVERLVGERTDAVLGSGDRTYADLSAELQREEAGAPSEEARVAARIVRASLTEILRRRPAAGPPARGVLAGAAPAAPVAAQASRPEPAAAASPPVAKAPVPAAPPAAKEPGAKDLVAKAPVAGETLRPAAAPKPADAPANPPGDLVDTAFAEAERLVQAGMFQQAIEVLRSCANEALGERGIALEQRIAAVRKDARTALDALLAEVDREAARDQVGAALTRLLTAAYQFPSTAEFAALGERIAALQAKATASQAKPGRARGAADEPAEATRRTTLASLRALLDQVRAAETGGDFATAERLLRDGADQVRAGDPDFADRLLQRAKDHALLAQFHVAVADQVAAGAPFEIALRAGSTAKLVGTDGPSLLVASGAGGGGSQRISWLEVVGKGVRSVVEAGRLGGDAVLGAAALLYRNGEGADAEALLAKLLAAEPARKAEIDAALARGRGERLDDRGYVLLAEGFVAVRTVEARKSAERLLARLDGVLRNKDPQVRAAFVTDLLAQGPDALESIVLAFAKELQKEVAQIEKSNLRKQVDKLAAQRAQLDQARKHALELIYDEVRYFYPYRPPAVASDRYAEYIRVQAEVDSRVESVRAIWRDDRLKVKVPAALQQDLDRLDFVAKVLADLGELDPAALAEVDWARALPPGDRIDVQNYCRTAQERRELHEWSLVERLNREQAKLFDSGAREQLEVTNEYRRMFRHRPLAMDARLWAAARGHAEEMSKLGYFAHFSPTPERRTPYDRMRLAGYVHGASENIALNDSAPSAHDAWCHSSGHHRNLLNPAHTEVGVGAVGRYWVQNFGSGRDFMQAAGIEADGEGPR
jgi:hypothetical protein